MRSLLGRRPSPAMVVACLSLLVALGGTSVAAVSALPRGSVGTPQLKNNAVTSVKVRNRSLRAVDFARGQLPAGPAGPAGPVGPVGPAGPAGPAGAPGVSGLERRDSATASNSTGQKTVKPQCPAGKKAVGGGARIEGAGLTNSFAIVETWPDSDGVSWNAKAIEVVTTPENWVLRGYVLCATA